MRRGRIWSHRSSIVFPFGPDKQPNIDPPKRPIKTVQDHRAAYAEGLWRLISEIRKQQPTRAAS